MRKIVHRYIFREVATPFVVGLSVFTFVLLIARLMRLIELVVNRGLPATTILWLFTYILPAFLEVTVPMAMLLAILVALGRLSADSELVALRSSGLSLYQLVPPIAIFVVIAMGATAWLSVVARPWGNRALHGALWDIAQTRATAGLRPQVFNTDFPGLVIYAEQIEAQRDRLAHVLISDERSPSERNVIFAREGYLLSNQQAQTITLRLVGGAIRTTQAANQAEYQTDFQTYDVHLDLRDTLGSTKLQDLDAKELTLAELESVIRDKQQRGESTASELVEYHRKFSIPFACLVFGVVAVPFGITSARAVKSRGFAVSIGIIFAYYVLLSAGQGLAEQGVVPAVVGLWLPNVVFLLLGTTAFRQVARERPLLPEIGVADGLRAVRRRLVPEAA